MVLQMNDSVLSVGRSKECDIRFKHPSISRNHCLFLLKKKGFYLIDKDSKYGTFKSLGKTLLKKNKDMIISFGKYLMEIHPFKSKPC